MLSEIAVWWGDWKIALGEWLSLSPDALHIHISVLLFLLFAFLTRWRWEGALAWLLLLAVELFNEIIDLNQPFGSFDMNLAASRHDVLNTMFLPTILIAVELARRRGFLSRARRKRVRRRS